MNGAERLNRRRWRFASCVFDEANWTLVVDGRRVHVEAKPLELLRELLLRAGNVVTKDDLLDNIWPGLHVVEASLPTAVGKLRKALRDDRHDIVETVAGIGYRIPVQVELVDGYSKHITHGPDVDQSTIIHASPAAAAKSAPAFPRLMVVAGGLAIGLAGLGLAFPGAEHADAAKSQTANSQQDAANALRKLDVGEIEKMLASGWNPNATFDKDGTDSMGYLLNMCEWDPAHDQRKLMLMGRTLLEGGLDIQHRNFWGDTAYSIAKAKRYCGPDHPVTKMLKALCYNGLGAPGDRCLAAYELSPAQRKAQGLPSV